MTRDEVCKNCDSTSQEMCLLIRHCPLWVDRPGMSAEEIKDAYKNEWIRRSLQSTK